MIFTEEFRSWLRDRSAQTGLQGVASRFGAAWNEGPVHRGIAQLLASSKDEPAETLVECLTGLFADHWWVDRLVAALAERMREQPFFDPPFRLLNSDVHRGLVVYEDELASIAVGVIGAAELAAKKSASRARTSIGFTGQVSVLKFLKAGEAYLSFWEAPRIAADFTSATAGKCRRSGRRRIDDGEVIVVDGRSQSFVIDHARANLLVIQAVVKPDHAPVSVEYDSETHEYVGCSAADDSASRIQMITTLLRTLDFEAGVPAMIPFLDNPNFFVRWHVMRELLALDARAALPHLKRMAASDPHPETRMVARQVLDMIEAPATSRRKAA